MANNRELSQFASLVSYDSSRIGIGTDSFNDAAEVMRVQAISSQPNTIFTIKANNNSSGASILNFGDDDFNEGRIIYDHSDNSMQFRTNDAEKLRIDSGGRLQVGRSASDSSDSLLIVQGNAGDTGTGGQISIQRGGNANPTAPSDLGSLVFKDSAAGRGAVIAAQADADWNNNDYPSRLIFKVTPDNASAPVERMRINRKGFMKMGPRITDSSHGAADLNSARHEFTSDDNGWTIIVTHTSGAASEHEGILIDYNLDPNGTANSFIQGNANDTLRFRVASNGGLYNYQSNDSNLCDEREKKNIVSLDSKWDKVKNWELKKFHYNEDADSDDLRYGVIAQQVEEYCPEVLSEWVKQPAKEAVLDDDGNVVTPAVAEVTRKGVKEQQMMWMAIKALQEAQTRIETLEAQVAALQGS
jgi:hypothetical protein